MLPRHERDLPLLPASVVAKDRGVDAVAHHADRMPRHGPVQKLLLVLRQHHAGHGTVGVVSEAGMAVIAPPDVVNVLVEDDVRHVG